MCVIHIYIHTHFSYLFAPGAYKPLGATRTELFCTPTELFKKKVFERTLTQVS